MYALDIDGSNQADLTPFDSVQVRIVDDLEEILEEVLILLCRLTALVP